MRIGTAAASVAIAVLAGACDDGASSLTEAPATTVTAEDAELFLVVSNQSFQRPSVHLEVRIDGERVIAEVFEVEGQHNFVGFALAAAPGRHTLEAVAAGDVRAEGAFTVPAGRPVYGTILFWADAETGPMLDIRFSDDPPAFG